MFWVCRTCGVEHATASDVCAICADDRQWVPAEGQQWATLEQLVAEGMRSQVAVVEDGLVAIGAREHDEIAQTFPTVLRRVGGYNLDVFNPRSVRPWQHVLEPLSGYLLLAAKLASEGGAAFAGAWNFGPASGQAVDVETLARAIMNCSPVLDLPIRFGADADAPHEAAMLRLDSSKAATELGWKPRLSVDETLSLTADWYAAFLRGDTDMRELSRSQLDTYLQTRSSSASNEGLRRCA